jgi:transcriptional regulator with XRE-family HTH domain
MATRPTRRRQTIFVGSKIRQLRKERGLTQAVLAKKIGVQQSDLCRMENGEYKVALDTLFRILGVFGMKIGDFFQGSDEQTAPMMQMDQETELSEMIRQLDETSRQEVLEFVRFKIAARRGISNG